MKQPRTWKAVQIRMGLSWEIEGNKNDKRKENAAWAIKVYGQEKSIQNKKDRLSLSSWENQIWVIQEVVVREIWRRVTGTNEII